MYGEPHDLNDRRSQMHAALGMGIVFICIGFPIWWKTTEVYHAELPYTEIQDLSQTTALRTQINVTLLLGEQQSWAANIYQSLLKTRSSEGLMTMEYSFATVTMKEHDRLDLLNGEYDKWNEENSVLVAFEDLESASSPTLTVTAGRLLIFRANQDFLKTEPDKISTQIMQLITDSIVNRVSLDDVISKAYGTKMELPKERDAHIMKTVRSNKGYDIVFSLLVPEPGDLRVTWDIEEAVNLYMSKMISQLTGFAEFKIGSQILYYSGLPVMPKIKNPDDKNKGYYLTHKQLSHVINPIESRLGSQVSPNPTLNFVVYVAEEKYTPLHIQKEDGSYSLTNTFLVPRWGAIKIQNFPKRNTDPSKRSLIRAEAIDGQQLMGVFLAQLRALLGIEEPKDIQDIDLIVLDVGETALRDWEWDYLVRARIVENIATSIHTLNSLAQLLGKIHNIVINDNIGEHVYTAVRALHEAKVYLASGELRQALNCSNIAFRSSEIAFFDQTLLELLYFPEDQKFAIYIPLFLPIALPLLGSLINALKWLKRGKGEKEKAE